MTVESGKENFRLGFLTAIEVPERGFVGGLLVTNHFGRPLEFQCTAPLKPNRAQEILYGPTLVPYVLGDLIGRTLIEKVGVKPHLVLTERNDLLPMRELVSIPVACVDDFLASAPALPAPNGPETTVPPLAAEPSDPIPFRLSVGTPTTRQRSRTRLGVRIITDPTTGSTAALPARAPNLAIPCRPCGGSGDRQTGRRFGADRRRPPRTV